MADPVLPGFDFAAAIRLFDETTSALGAQVRRLEEVLTAKQAELVQANARLTEKVTELDRLTDWLNLVMGSIASGVLAVDTSGRVTTCNEAACAALEGVLPDLIDADYRTAFPDGPAAQVLITGRPEGPAERTVRTATGGTRILRLRAAPLRTPTGMLLGAVEVLDDISELRALQEQAERVDRLKRLGEMAAGVAHEIRNPLNGIEGFASLLARDLPAESKQARYAQAVVDGVRDLNRTVSGLLEFTRTRRIQRRNIDPAGLAKSCLALVAAEEVPDIALAVEDRWPGGTAQIDGPQIKQVLLNLLQNAVHALSEREPAGGRIILGIARLDGLLEFTVDDDGPGVPPAERARIFTPFHTTREQGTGLGLALSLTIAQLHEGTIAVETSTLGGARFRLMLPVGAIGPDSSVE
jgi:signal transduction histidine kinase